MRLLVTVREGLGIAGETQYRVPSLSFPNGRRIATPDDPTSDEAVQFFGERARSAKSSFSLTDDNTAAGLCFFDNVAERNHRLHVRKDSAIGLFHRGDRDAG